MMGAGRGHTAHGSRLTAEGKSTKLKEKLKGQRIEGAK